MKKTKKNYIAIILVVLLLALAVGYAAFSQVLTITGTATTVTGNWDVKFTAAEASASVVSTNPDVVNSAEVTADDTVTVNVALQAPGDGSNVSATITNSGKLDAKLTSFTVEGRDGTTFEQNGKVYTDGEVIITVPDVSLDGTSDIAADSSREFIFTVEWDEEAEGTVEQTTSFDIKFTYEQGDVTFTGKQSFDEV